MLRVIIKLSEEHLHSSSDSLYILQYNLIISTAYTKTTQVLTNTLILSCIPQQQPSNIAYSFSPAVCRLCLIADNLVIN